MISQAQKMSDNYWQEILEFIRFRRRNIVPHKPEVPQEIEGDIKRSLIFNLDQVRLPFELDRTIHMLAEIHIPFILREYERDWVVVKLHCFSVSLQIGTSVVAL